MHCANIMADFQNCSQNEEELGALPACSSFKRVFISSLWKIYGLTSCGNSGSEAERDDGVNTDSVRVQLF